MRKLLLLLLLFAPAAFGQNSPGASYQWGGNITAANAACVIKACVGIQLPSPIASTISVGLTGTWSATLAVEESQDGGRTYTSAGASLTSNGTTTYTITAFTNFRVRASAFVSGNAGVNLQVGASGSGGGGGGTPGGSNTEIQFNDSSSFGGDPNLTWDKTTGSFNASGGANGDSSIIAGTNGLNGMGCQGDSSGNFCDLTATELAARVLLIASGDVLVRPNLNGAGGKLKVGLATGAASGEIEFEGKTSGAGEIGVADVAGTPNKILLPIATGTANTCLQTDGGSPQQTSWTGCGNATAANSGFAGPGSIYPNAPPYNISFDGKGCYGHVTWTTGANPTITLDGTICSFAASEFGTSTKKVFGTPGCCANLSAVAAANTLPLGTITIVNATTATSNATATAACSVTATCEIHWFTDDRAKWCCGAGTVDNAWNTALVCPTVILPVGFSPIPFGLFNQTSSRVCSNASFSGDNQVSELPGGEGIMGQGIGNSVLIIPPDEVANMTAKCIGPNGGGTGCLFAGATVLQNFSVNGGGFGLTGTHNNMIVVNPSGIANFINMVSFTGFGSGDTGSLIGFQFPFSNMNNGVYVDQLGHTGCTANGTNVIIMNSFCGDVIGTSFLASGSPMSLRTQNFYWGFSQGANCVIVNSGVTWWSVGDQNYGSCNAGSSPGISVLNGGEVHISSHAFQSSTNSKGLQLQATAKAYIRDSRFTGSVNCWGTGGVTLTTGALFDEGGNTCLGTAPESTVIPTCTQSAGNGTCAAVTGSSNEKGIIRITAGTTTLLNPSFTMTFAGTYAGASLVAQPPSCNFSISNTGTGSWITAAPTGIGLPFVTSSSQTAQIVNILTTVNTVATSTYDVAYNCTAK